MKTQLFTYRISVCLFCAISSLLLFSCDDSFLNENQMPEYTELNDTIYVTNTAGSFELDFTFNTNEACNWQLVQYPYWLQLSPAKGRKAANQSAHMNFMVNESDITMGIGLFSFPLVFDIDGRLVGYTVVLGNFGHPNIHLANDPINFDNSLSKTIEIGNEAEGILNWWIESAPDWLITDKLNGLVQSYETQTVTLSIDINDLDPGEYKGTLVIKSNAVNQPTVSIQVSVKIGANANYGEYHIGELIDARYNKQRDEVIVLTKTPNQLHFFNSEWETPVTIDLDRVPLCLALSEDESQIAVGYSNSEITTYNATNYNIIKTYNSGTIPLSIEFGNDNYLYFIATRSYSNYLHSLNLSSEEIIQSKEGEGGLKTLRKTPGKPMLVSTRPGYSPDGLILFDISEPGQTDSINSYHMTLNGHWISDDGAKLITGWHKIYDLPEYQEGQSFFPYELNATGELDFESTQVIDCAGSQSSTERIFAASGFHGSNNNQIIKIYNSKTLVEQKSFELTFARPDFFSVYSTWSGYPIALFPSVNEQDLWLVQNFAKYSYDGDGIWSVAKVNISK